MGDGSQDDEGGEENIGGVLQAGGDVQESHPARETRTAGAAAAVTAAGGAAACCRDAVDVAEVVGGRGKGGSDPIVLKDASRKGAVVHSMPQRVVTHSSNGNK